MTTQRRTVYGGGYARGTRVTVYGSPEYGPPVTIKIPVDILTGDTLEYSVPDGKLLYVYRKGEAVYKDGDNSEAMSTALNEWWQAYDELGEIGLVIADSVEKDVSFSDKLAGHPRRAEWYALNDKMRLAATKVKGLSQ